MPGSLSQTHMYSGVRDGHVWHCRVMVQFNSVHDVMNQKGRGIRHKRTRMSSAPTRRSGAARVSAVDAVFARLRLWFPLCSPSDQQHVLRVSRRSAEHPGQSIVDNPLPFDPRLLGNRPSIGVCSPALMLTHQHPLITAVFSRATFMGLASTCSSPATAHPLQHTPSSMCTPPFVTLD